MDDDSQYDKLTIEELIQLELAAIETIIEVIPDASPPLFFQIRDQLTALVDRLRDGKIQSKYAEVQLHQLKDVLDLWQSENQIPPN